MRSRSHQLSSFDRARRLSSKDKVGSLINKESVKKIKQGYF